MAVAVVAVAVAAGLGIAAGPVTPVAAHAGLEGTVPAASSVLDESPANIVLDFDEPVEGDLASIELFDGSARPVPIGDAGPSSSDPSIVLAELPELADGLYAVVWRVASIDGHVIDGSFSFQIGTGAPADGSSLLDQVSGGVSAARSVSALWWVARLATYLGLVALLGAGGWAIAGPSHLLETRPVRQLVTGGWAIAVAGTAIAYGSYGASVVAGTLADAVSPTVWADIAGTQTARMAFVRLALLVVLAALWWRRRARGSAWWREVAVATGIGSLITLPAAGHPSAASPKALWVLVDTGHLLAIVVWLGGLLLLAAGGRGWLADPAADTLVRRFSRGATVAVPVIVATGVAQTLELAGGVEQITETSWGRTLLVKVSVVSILVALGAVSRWLLLSSGARSLRRTAAAEAVLGLAVLGLTAGIVGSPPRAIEEGQVFTASLAQAGLIVDVTITPGRTGANEMHLVLVPPGGSLQPVASASARMSLPSRDLPATDVELVAGGSNHYSGTVTLPFSGEWTLELLVEVEPGSTTLIVTNVPIP